MGTPTRAGHGCTHATANGRADLMATVVLMPWPLSCSSHGRVFKSVSKSVSQSASKQVDRGLSYSTQRNSWLSPLSCPVSTSTLVVVLGPWLLFSRLLLRLALCGLAGCSLDLALLDDSQPSRDRDRNLISCMQLPAIALDEVSTGLILMAVLHGPRPRG